MKKEYKIVIVGSIMLIPIDLLIMAAFRFSSSQSEHKKSARDLVNIQAGYFIGLTFVGIICSIIVFLMMKKITDSSTKQALVFALSLFLINSLVVRIAF